MKTLATLRTMARGSWRNKIAHRLQAPGLIKADVRRVAHQVGCDLIRAYAAYHRICRTPGRVFTIPTRECRMWLPISWGETVAQRRFGVYETETFRTLRAIVRPGLTVVEVGACYGEFTIELARLVGPNGRVYAFELFPPYHAIAARNVALNGLTNVLLINRAVGRDGRPVTVDVSASNPYASLDQISHLDYSSRLQAAAAHASRQTHVDGVVMSRFLEEERLDPDLVFMDIEGCELEVLFDLQPLLRSPGRRPVVYLELHRGFYGEAGIAWLRGLFEASGYAIRPIAAHWLCTPERSPSGAPVGAFSGS